MARFRNSRGRRPFMAGRVRLPEIYSFKKIYEYEINHPITRSKLGTVFIKGCFPGLFQQRTTLLAEFL